SECDFVAGRGFSGQRAGTYFVCEAVRAAAQAGWPERHAEPAVCGGPDTDSNGILSGQSLADAGLRYRAVCAGASSKTGARQRGELAGRCGKVAGDGGWRSTERTREFAGDRGRATVGDGACADAYD